MERYTCTDRMIKNGRQIIGYILTSLDDGSQITVEPDDLKMNIRQGAVSVDNLTLTSDNKLRLNMSSTPIHVNTSQPVKQKGIKSIVSKITKLLLLDSGLVLDTLKFIGCKLIKTVFRL